MTPHSSGRPSLARSARHRPTARSTTGSPAADKISPAAKVSCSAGQRLPQSSRLANRRHDSLRSRSGRRSRRRYAASRTGERPNRAVVISTGPPPASVAKRASGLFREMAVIDCASARWARRRPAPPTVIECASRGSPFCGAGMRLVSEHTLPISYAEFIRNEYRRLVSYCRKLVL